MGAGQAAECSDIARGARAGSTSNAAGMRQMLAQSRRSPRKEMRDDAIAMNFADRQFGGVGADIDRRDPHMIR